MNPSRVGAVLWVVMKLGAFSVSLAVKSLSVSREFYQTLGFTPVGGDGEHYQIMRNEGTTLGLFQGMFENNILTFNPGWDAEGKPVDDFQDVRDIRAELATKGAEFASDTTGDSESGPASFVVVDPDGNAVLVDQHV